MLQEQEDEESENEGAVVQNAEVDSEKVTATEVGGGNNQSEDPSSSRSSGLEKSFSAVVNRKKDSYTLDKFRQFLEWFKVEGDASCYYVCQAIAIASCGSSSMHVRYSHLATCHDKDWVREMVNSKDRLAGQLATTALEFVRRVAAKFQIKREILELKLEYIQMPKSLERLQDVLVTPRITERLTVHRHSRLAVKPSPFGCEALSGILAYMVKNHRLGKSWNGQLTSNDFEVINGHQIIITKKPTQYEIGEEAIIPADTRTAFCNDLGVIPKIILPKFRVDNLSNPHHVAFKSCLEELKLSKITTWSSLENHYELVLHHPFLKPPIAVLNLFTGIHSCCRAHDEGDEIAWYKTVLATREYQEWGADEDCKSWIDLVNKSNNELLIEVLEYPDKGIAEPGRPMPEPYNETHQSFCSFVRHSGLHTTDNTRKRRPSQPVLLGKDGPVEEQKREPREQLVKFQDEVVTTAALFLAEVMEDVIASLINSDAMKGMLLPHWKVYKNCTSYDKSKDVENEDA